MAEQTVPVTQTHNGGKLPTTREESRYQIPPVDIYETQEGLTVVADMPGVDKDGIDVRVDNSILTLQGMVKPVAVGRGVHNEFALIDYFRQFQLGEKVDQNKISAEYKHGVLTIQLPKAEKVKPKQITVQVA